MRFWTEEEDRLVREGVNSGLSARQIALLLHDRTRNMVISRIRTLGIVMRTQARPHIPDSELGVLFKPEPVPERPKPAKAEVEAGNPVRLADAGPTQCRYPLWPDDGYGNPDFMVCGGEGRPWCERHRLLCVPKAARETALRSVT